MHPKSHALFRHGNLIELAIQGPFWVFVYGTGFVFFLEILAWVVYGLGWHYYPKTYPLPHSMFLDFVAELMRWIRYESPWGKTKKRLWLWMLGLGSWVLFPLVFIYYLKLLFWLWFGDTASGFKRMFDALF